VIGIDTNVFVRLLIADDPAQTRRARSRIERAMFQDEVVLVSLPVFIETEWVLRSRYGMRRDAALPVLRTALEARELSFEDESAIEEALHEWSDSPCGFADCLIAAHNRRLGCAQTLTFGAKAARLPGCSVLE
jgi:predicted nucleic-acid-binding protein